MSDRFGGGHVTFTAFLASILAGGLLVAVSLNADGAEDRGTPVTGLTMAGYIVGFIALFIFCGAGKGAVYKLIPSVFEERSRALGLDDSERHHWARVRSGALIGFAGAFGALGGVGINLALRQSYDTEGTETPAFCIFLACYAGAAVLTWARYVRSPAERAATSAPREPATGESIKTAVTEGGVHR